MTKSRVLRFVLGMLLIPALTGIGASACVSVAEAATSAGSRTSAPTTAHRQAPTDSRPMPTGHHREHSNRNSNSPCAGNSGTTCCPAMAGCIGQVIVPDTLHRVNMDIPTAEPVMAVSTERPTMPKAPPEPPPPKTQATR